MTIRRTRRRGKTSITCCASRINPPRRRRCCRRSRRACGKSCSRGWWPVCRAMPCAVRPRRRSAAVTQPAPLPLCAKASPAIRTIPWLRLDLARLLQKSGNGSEASSLMSAAYRPGASNSALYAAALFASEKRRLAAGADAAGAHSRRQPDQRHARFAPAGELQPAVGDGRKLPGAGQYHRRQQYPAGDGLHAAKSPGGRRQAGASAGRERRPDHRGLAGAQQYQQRRIRQCRGITPIRSPS